MLRVQFKRKICADRIAHVLRKIFFKMEYQIYMSISYKHGNKKCVISVSALLVHFIHAYTNQRFFLLVAARIMCGALNCLLKTPAEVLQAEWSYLAEKIIISCAFTDCDHKSKIKSKS